MSEAPDCGTLGKLHASEMARSFMRQTIKAMNITQARDEALLRQALEALDYHCTVKIGHEQPMYELWEALRERLGVKE